MAGFARRTLLPNGADVSGTRLIYPLTIVTCDITGNGSNKSDTSAQFAMWGDGVVFKYDSTNYYYYTVYYETPNAIAWDQDSFIRLPRFANYPYYGCVVGTIDRRDGKDRGGISHLDVSAPYGTNGPGIWGDMHIDGVSVNTAIGCRINITASAIDRGYSEPYTGWIKVS